MGGLPSIGGRGGRFEVDESAARKGQAELDRLAQFEQPVAVVDNRSMQEIAKAKREQTEAKIEESKVESVEQRKARLMAQRDLLREHKKKQMAQELDDFNAKATNKDSLFSELKKIDDGKQKGELGQDEIEKRRQILKGVKQQIEAKTDFSMSQKPGSSILDDLEAFKV